MRVLKRNGTYQDVQFDKITTRLRYLSTGLTVDPVLVAQKVCGKLMDGIRTSELDEFSAETCMSMYTIHPDYSVLGSRIVVDNHRKNTPSDCLGAVTECLTHILHPEYVELVRLHKDIYNAMMVHDRDFLLDYFGMKTLIRSYLLKSENKDNVIERPQHMWMRVAIFLHRDNFVKVQETYDMMSTKQFTHASPTLFNAGTRRPQMSSCFVAGTPVYTVNRGLVPIESVTVNDQVVTHTGSVRPVTQTHVNPLGDRTVYSVHIHHTAAFKVTGNHRLWTYDSESRRVDWKPVDEMSTKDFVAVPRLPACTDTDAGVAVADMLISKAIDAYAIERSDRGITVGIPNGDNRHVIIPSPEADDEFMWVVGVVMASARVIYSYVERGIDPDIIGIEMDIASPSHLDRVVRLLGMYFGVEDHVHVHRYPSNASIVRINHTALAIALRHWTLVSPLEGLSRAHVGKWLQGYIDGSMVVDMEPENITIDVTKHSARYMRQLCAHLKMAQYDVSDAYNLCYGNCTLLVIQVNILYNRLTVDGTSFIFSDNIRSVDGQLFARVHHLCVDQNPPDTVYTIGVDTDHSYGINGVVAENCFLTTVDDSVDGIFKTLTDCAQISKWAGGIGINISDVRGTNSVIRSTNGRTNGILPLLKTYNAVGRYINQCFVGSTMVYTRDGPKTIKSIVAGMDHVLTSDGTYRTVHTVHANPIPTETTSILKIRNAYTLDAVKCTREHELYVSKDQGKTFAYIPASELCVDDMMAFPIPTESIDVDTLTMDMCRLYGIILASGYYSAEEDCYLITMPKRIAADTIEFVQLALPNAGMIDDDTKHVTFRFDIATCGLKHDWIYPHDKTKAIHGIFLNLPLDKLEMVLYGIFEKTTTHAQSRSPNIYFVNTNRMLIESIRYALIRFGVLSSGNKLYTFGGYCMKVPSSPSRLNGLYRLLGMTTIVPTEGESSPPIASSHIAVTVRSIQTIPVDAGTIVYDLGIEDNHNYTTHMGLVHNSGKRLGSFAMYIEPWHVDIFDFLNAKKAVGSEEERARDLFYGLWVPDLFMERVKADGTWSLMCPDECRGLTSCYGSEFKDLYTQYEREGKYRKQVKARRVWDAIIEMQIESGNPYMVYKDHVNHKSPQANIGVIKQSNLCTEIVLYTDKDHISVCNLASIALPSFLTVSGFDFEALARVARVVTRNLDLVIDYNYYPVREAETTNKKHRPIGIGVQGLADVFAMMRYPFDSPEARNLNRRIFECIYHAALSESCLLAKEKGAYAYFDGSPMSQGILQFDMWEGVVPSADYDWPSLKADIAENGLRNSTLVSPMPTASTSQILGFNECLPGDTMVTDAHGVAHPIFSLQSSPRMRVMSYNENMHCTVPSRMTEFMDKGDKTVQRIVLAFGQSIESTPNHKFRTLHRSTGAIEWTEAQNITRDHDLIMSSAALGIDGTVYGDYATFSTSVFTQRFEGIATPEQCLALTRLTGFAQGDGNTISETSATLYVKTMYDLSLLLTDMALIDTTRSFSVVDSDVDFAISVGRPIASMLYCMMDGKPAPAIPSVLMDPMCPQSAIHAFVAAYCGADSLAPYLVHMGTGDGDGNGTACPDGAFYGCDIMRAVDAGSDAETRVFSFMQGLVTLFGRLGMHTYLGKRLYVDSQVSPQNKESVVFTLVVSDIYRFCTRIGYSYSIHKTLRNNLVQMYARYITAVKTQWSSVIKEALVLYHQHAGSAASALKEAVEKFPDVFIDESSVPTVEQFKECLDKGCMVDMPMVTTSPEGMLDKIGLVDWFATNESVIEKTKLCVPLYRMAIIDIKRDAGVKRVYDINVAKTHSFMANGVVVHNCIEPFTSNLYARRTLVGEFVCINKHLVRDLTAEGLWTKDIMEQLLYHRGSVQYIPQIPQWMKDVYRTVWEIKQRSLIEMAADRGAFICQSQSLNLFFEDPNYRKITAAHFLGWKLGLKTGSYYIRTQSAIDAQSVTIDPTKEEEYKRQRLATTDSSTTTAAECPMRRKGQSIEECEACSG